MGSSDHQRQPMKKSSRPSAGRAPAPNEPVVPSEAAIILDVLLPELEKGNPVTVTKEGDHHHGNRGFVDEVFEDCGGFMVQFGEDAANDFSVFDRSELTLSD